MRLLTAGILVLTIVGMFMWYFWYVQRGSLSGNPSIWEQREEGPEFLEQSDEALAAWDVLLDDLPVDIRAGLKAKQTAFLEDIMVLLTMRTSTDVCSSGVLPDKAWSDRDWPSRSFFHSFIFEGLGPSYRPKALEELGALGVSLNKSQIYLSSIATPCLLAMVEAARAQGVELELGSGFRSYDYQQEVWDRSLRNRGLEHTQKYLAWPGYSEHQLGLTVDFTPIEAQFQNTEQYAWLQKQAGSFGFSLSYPEDTPYAYSPESWHYRYLSQWGVKIKNEYFQGSHYWFLYFFDKHYVELYRLLEDVL